MDLAGERNDRCAHAVGGEQGRRGIEDAGTRYHSEDLRFAGDERGPERHVGGGLLVAGMDDAEPVAGALGGVEQMVVVHTGQGIQRVDACCRRESITASAVVMRALAGSGGGWCDVSLRQSRSSDKTGPARTAGPRSELAEP